MNFSAKKVSIYRYFLYFCLAVDIDGVLKTYKIMKKNSNDLIVKHPLQINASRVTNLINACLYFLDDTDISKSKRLQSGVDDLTNCLQELEKLRVNLCDFRSELQYMIHDLNEEDLSF